MNTVLKDIYGSGSVYDAKGNKYKLHSHIDRDEGDFIYNIINTDDSIKKTLEIGCAYGLSSLFICSATSGRKNNKHVIIDPFQYRDWKGIGILNLEKCGFKFFELVEQPSEFSLPELVRTNEGTFDLIFIDGFHTFDHTLLDIFYGNRLLRVGGYMIIDDCWFKSVSKAISYLSNYPAYELFSQVKNIDSRPSRNRKIGKFLSEIIPKPLWDYIFPNIVYEKVRHAQYSSMVAFKKVSEDGRQYDWYKAF